jgi:hypothetical protein
MAIYFGRSEASKQVDFLREFYFLHNSDHNAGLVHLSLDQLIAMTDVFGPGTNLAFYRKMIDVVQVGQRPGANFFDTGVLTNYRKIGSFDACL